MLSHMHRINGAICLCVLLLCGMTRVHAAQFDIPAQNLEDALLSFSEQAGIQLVVADETIKGLKSAGVRGEYSADQALTALLEGSGLKFRVTDEKTIAISGGKGTRVSTLGRGAGGPVEDNARLAEAAASASEANQGSVDGKIDSNTNSADSAVEEIIVTAQKRAERIQDVPISISVMNGEQLDTSTAQGITEALGRVPGVATMVGHQGGGTLVAMRGVSAGAVLFNGSSPIAFYVDSVPFGLVKSAIAPDPNAYDMERVEVLRGPQSTLYGASAQNGVVRVLSKDANLDKLDFKGRTSVSSTQDADSENSRIDAAVNVPIVAGKLAARAVVGYQRLSGWIDNPNEKDANDAELRTFRLKVNAQPSENLSVGASAWLSRNDFDAPSTGFDRGHSSAVAREPMYADYSAYGLKIGYEFAAFSVSSMTSYLDYANDSFMDYTPLVANNILETGVYSKIFSQEFNLNSKNEGPWQWSAGGIYRDGKDKLFQDREGYVAYTDLRDYSKSAAVFGQVTRGFLDRRLELTAGLRYFQDDVTNRELARTSGAPANQLITDSDKFHKVSPRLVLAWHPHPEMTVYASYAEGFRSGFPQNGNILATAPQFAALKSDNLQNYELGAKGSLWGGSVSFDVAAFYIDWQDVQQTVTVNVGTVASPINLSALINGESASGPGFEMALTTKPLEGLMLSANLSWNDLNMDSVVRSFGPGAPADGFVLYNAGDRLNLSAEYTAGAAADYEFPLSDSGYVGRLGASANYTSAQEYRTIFSGVSLAKGDSILISRASFSIDSPSRWSTTFFVDNLNDEDGTPVATPFRAPTWNLRVRPRTIGAQLEYRY